MIDKKIELKIYRKIGVSKDGVLNMPVLCAQLPLSMVYDEPYAPIRSSLLAGKSDARIGLIVGWLSGGGGLHFEILRGNSKGIREKSKSHDSFRQGYVGACAV